MIAQCKGKDLDKVPASKLLGSFMASVKYDGHYVQIHKIGNIVRFFTSGGKEFYHAPAANELLKYNFELNYVLEAEYIADTNCKLGNRGKASKLTTLRTNFEKGLPNDNTSLGEDSFMVFDIIIENKTFQERLSAIKENLMFLLNGIIRPVDYIGPMSLNDCEAWAKIVRSDGYEGLYLKSPKHLYKPGKRVNDAIKLKLRPTADLMCIGTMVGEGKYQGMIGSVVLQDSEGRVVRVGAGLSDEDRARHQSHYLNKIVEFEYEQILDTYIQPTFIAVRSDKTESD